MIISECCTVALSISTVGNKSSLIVVIELRLYNPHFRHQKISMALLAQLVTLYRIQKLRYSKKGLANTLIAIFLLLCVLKGANLLCHSIWPSQVDNKPLFLVLVSFTIHFVCQGLYYLVYYPGYSGLVRLYDNYRINKGARRPWEDNPQWPALRRRLFAYLSVNYLLVYPAMVYLSTAISGVRYRFDDMPSTWELAWQLLFVAFVEDAGFYWAHRLAHEWTWLYRFHKIHHEYTEVFSLVTEFTHPLDYILGVLIPSAIPFMILGPRAHCFMFFFWQTWKIFISTEGHCGYSFPWSPTRIFLFVSDSSFHDYHHTKNVGNYCGSIYLWDYFNGSSRSYFEQYGVEFMDRVKSN